MSVLLHKKKLHPEVTVKGAAKDIPLQICLETLGEIGELGCYESNMALKIGEAVLLVKDAP